MARVDRVTLGQLVDDRFGFGELAIDGLGDVGGFVDGVRDIRDEDEGVVRAAAFGDVGRRGDPGLEGSSVEHREEARDRGAAEDEVLGLRAGFDRRAHLVGGLVAIVGVEGERGDDDGLELGRIIGDPVRGRRDVAMHDPLDALEFGGCVEGAVLRGELVGEHAEREDIGAAIDGVAARLLGSHVAGFAFNEAGARLGHARGGFGDAEIDQLDRAVVGDEDVGGRDIAVNDVERRAIGAAAFVRVVEPCRGGGDDGQAEVERHPQAAVVDRLEDGADGLAVDVLHGEEVGAVGGAPDVIDLGDVLVVEGGSEARLVEEHTHIGLVRNVLFAQGLEDHVALEAREACDTCQEHLRHPTGCEMGNQLEPA